MAEITIRPRTADTCRFFIVFFSAPFRKLCAMSENRRDSHYISDSIAFILKMYNPLCCKGRRKFKGYLQYNG